MNYVLFLFILSLLLNFILGALVVLQRVRVIVTKQAMNDLLERVARLETFAKRPPEKITIVSQNNKETPNEQT